MGWAAAGLVVASIGIEIENAEQLPAWLEGRGHCRHVLIRRAGSIAQKQVCSQTQSHVPRSVSGNAKRSPTQYCSAALCGCRWQAVIAAGERSRPIGFDVGSAAAIARTSCPVPQPGTKTVPVMLPGWPRSQATRGGAASPLSQGVSPIRYCSSQSGCAEKPMVPLQMNRGNP